MYPSRTAVYRHAAALLIVLALPAYAPAQVAPGSEGRGAAATPAIHIANFGRVDATYYRGAQPKAGDYVDLAALGIRTVIDLTKDGNAAEAGMVRQAGMKFYRLPMTTHDTPTPESIARFLRIVDDPANQPVYVHCQGGRHRTGVMTAVYRMEYEHWTPGEAVRELKANGFGEFACTAANDYITQYILAYQPGVRKETRSRRLAEGN